jgi:Cu-Zn family superoxide dismutase
MKALAALLVGAGLAFASGVEAAQVTVTIRSIDDSGEGKELGTIAMRDSRRQGLYIMPKLIGLPPGLHGFHVHENPSCGATAPDGKIGAGLAAGGHFDPAKTGKHLGPENPEGHRGDLPILVVDGDGTATLPMLAPRLTVDAVRARSVIIHAGGDNYADQPLPLGGGGARIACGVIP